MYMIKPVNDEITVTDNMASLGDAVSYDAAMISPQQIRAARALLGWRQTDLAAASGLSEISIKNIERGATDARSSTIGKIEAAFSEAGVIFLDAGVSRDGGAGVRLR